MITKQLLEEELYEPIKNLFTSQGYVVKAEVKGCDVTAIKDGELVIIELKRGMSIKLLSQCVDRQKIGNSVYCGIFRPKKNNLKDISVILQKLGLGLIVVDVVKNHKKAEIIVEPGSNKKVTSVSRRKHIIREAESRTIDCNCGGATRQKIMTAYRELSLSIACYLENNGPSSPASIKKAGIDSLKTSSILNKNFYGWFLHESRGVYGISDKGKNALENYTELTKFYREVYGKNI